MAKAKRRAKPQAVALDFVDTIREGEGWVSAAVPTMPGERRTATGTRRRESRVKRWKRDGWVTDNEANALERYEGLSDISGYGGVRSCCDMSIRGNGDGLPPAVVRARHSLALARNAVSAVQGGSEALMAVHEFLAFSGDPDAIRRQFFGGSREYQVECARGAVKLVGMELARHFGA